MIISKKISVFAILFALILFFVLPILVFAQVPFGGPVLSITPCANGVIWTLIGPPTPMSLIWYPGTISFLMGPPWHVGQWLLGMAGAAPGFCILGKHIVGVGFPIIFHGSSI